MVCNTTPLYAPNISVAPFFLGFFAARSLALLLYLSLFLRPLRRMLILGSLLLQLLQDGVIVSDNSMHVYVGVDIGTKYRWILAVVAAVASTNISEGACARETHQEIDRDKQQRHEDFCEAEPTCSNLFLVGATVNDYFLPRIARIGRISAAEGVVFADSPQLRVRSWKKGKHPLTRGGGRRVWKKL